MRKLAQKTMILIAAVSCTPFATMAGAADVVRTPLAVPMRSVPDLMVASLTAERVGLRPDGSHLVRVSALLRCASASPVTAGPFKVLLERRDGRAGAWSRLGEAGVASLSSGGGTSAALPSELRTFEDAVPSGRVREYRATIDSALQVAESNEGNNQATAFYRATGCAGADLELTRVELRRHGAGALVHVWVRNRCLEPCAANLVYVIDDGEVMPGSLGIEQPIGPRIEGDTTVGPLGNAVAGGREGADITYTVRIEARGGPCRETSTANNSCRVTLRAGEAARTFTCAH